MTCYTMPEWAKISELAERIFIARISSLTKPRARAIRAIRNQCVKEARIFLGIKGTSRK